MEVITRSIDDIKPYENNPRTNEDAIDATANSIKQFGWQQPIVVDIGGVIIAGHTRYAAAKKLGLKEVPVVVADNLTPEQVNAYRLADNKTGELANWDFDKLDTELQKIDNLDMTDFGFENIEEPDLPDDFFAEKDTTEKADDTTKNIMLDWGTNSTSISDEEQEMLDEKFDMFNAQKEGNKSFLQFLLNE